jgi:DNA-binding PadR family transcriptional regulator
MFILSIPKSKLFVLFCFGMDRMRLSENQYLVLLAVSVLAGDGYSVLIQEKIRHDTGVLVPRGTLHRALQLFEREEAVISSSHRIRTGRRGRKTVRLYQITDDGRIALTNEKTARRRTGLLRG